MGRSSSRTHTSNTMAEVDLTNRDPNSINDHLKVTFEDILAEPEGGHSIDCVWANSYKCFNCCKNICYMIMTPCFKCLELNCGCCQKLYGMCIHCCLDPLC